jgi:hypothetical protein
VLRVLPRMAGEAPPEYVAFVERHLERLRGDAARVMGDESDADLLYPEVLTDVAARWGWLELLHTRFGRRDEADRYLRRSFLRRCERWRSDQESHALVLVDIRVLRPGESDWRPETPDFWPDAPAPRRYAPTRSSAATRLAPHLRSTVRGDFGPVAEAAVAWWHAYEAHRRRLLVYWLIAALVVLLLLLRIEAPRS